MTLVLVIFYIMYWTDIVFYLNDFFPTIDLEELFPIEFYLTLG